MLYTWSAWQKYRFQTWRKGQEKSLLNYAHRSVRTDGSPHCTHSHAHMHLCFITVDVVNIHVFKCWREEVYVLQTQKTSTTQETHIHTGPVSSLSGLFKSSLCFYSVTCAYHCSDFYLAGGRTFQGNGWPRITHTHTQDDWVSEVLHPFVAQAYLNSSFLTQTWHFMWGQRTSFSQACILWLG